MASEVPYAIIYAPIAESQIDAALLWWKHHRPAAVDLLARELDGALAQLAITPQIGRRVRLRGFSAARRILLPRSSYHLHYVVSKSEHLIQVVFFRHSHRRPVR